MMGQAEKVPAGAACDPDIFDRDHLNHYTMSIPGLDAEVVGLFLAQLPETISMIECARSAADWKLATHTLKGSASSVGARRINQIAASLEELRVDGEEKVKALRIQLLKAAAAEFRETAGLHFRTP
ncbi:Hpt domain-containing protein [Aestuariivirga sp.]|uniref:Hpt domain-containing protein n=1 Tax=Aestuariivirga sp. TaxID=2650926 RepID=UPI0035948C23